MKATVLPNALDRVPLSIILDDSCPLLNLTYFWIRDRNPVDGEQRRWEDVPIAIPESFTRGFGEWCREAGVKGKFSVVPYPAMVGRVDGEMPPFSWGQLERWIKMCRETLCPNYDITPEMLTHTFVCDPETLTPLEPRIWEQYEWAACRDEQLMTDLIARACRMLHEVGLTPEGVTSPGGFGGKVLELYARAAMNAVRGVTGNPTPFFFKRIVHEPPNEVPVRYLDREAGTAVGEIIANSGDWTGSWTGYGEVDADQYITADLQGGRLPLFIDHGGPCVLCSHYPGFYGLGPGDQRGFEAFKVVVQRLKERDPRGERTRWRKVSEITHYACARAAAELKANGDSVTIEAPILAPEFTLRLEGVQVRDVRLDGTPLVRAPSRQGFESGSFWVEGETTLVALALKKRNSKLEVA